MTVLVDESGMDGTSAEMKKERDLPLKTQGVLAS